ncbi:integrase [Rhizobium sp. CG5]|uniref:integrase n=1 Tax=Rhizobium sp. CG5 TaxID=2726076 RepID=UPI0020349BEE|nr:integrase [Rhizobium sp. CG5]MCM2476341.1 integrase [Rhizobium sp. CG5]
MVLHRKFVCGFVIIRSKNRTACLSSITNDNVAQSPTFLIIAGMSRFIEENSALMAPDDAALTGDTASPTTYAGASSPEILSSRPADTKRGVVRPDGRGANSAHTLRAYASDWKHYSAWCRRQDVPLLPPDAQVVGLYITACASRAATASPNGRATLERRLSSLAWNYRQRGLQLDRSESPILAALAALRSEPSQPRIGKEAIGQRGLSAMLEILDRGTLRGLRDRAILLLGSAGGLRRSEIVGLDVGEDQSRDGSGWIEFTDGLLLITLKGRSGLRCIKIARSVSEGTCPLAALQTWLRFARIQRGPLFRRVIGRGRVAGPERLNAQEVDRLVKRSALAAGIISDVSAQSLRARPAPDQQRDGTAFGDT